MATADGIRTFSGAVAIVTGAASGIGLALARQLAERGATVVLADLQPDPAQEAAEQIAAGGGHATAVGLDVTDSDAVRRVIQEVAAAHGRLDYLFNVAGIMVSGPAEDHSPEVMRRAMDTNFGGVSHAVFAAYPILVEQGFGHIVNMASLAGLVPLVSIGYSASKHAIVGLSLALRSEAAAHGVRVSVVCPGAVRTDMLRDGGKFGIQLGSPARPAEDTQRTAMSSSQAMGASQCAALTLRGVERDQPIIVFPRRAQRLWRRYRTFPRAMLRILQRRSPRVRGLQGTASPPHP